jgi:hypothetical protein
MPSVISNLKAKINDLKTRVAHNSISPVFVGGILDEIVDASTAAAEAAAAQSTADSALAATRANADAINKLDTVVTDNAADIRTNAEDIRVNTEALTILNRRGQVEPFAAVLTTDPDDDPIPEELVGKRVWSTQFNKFLDIIATEEVDYKPPYQVPEDSAAVVDKFYVCDGRLYLGVKVSQTATTLKPLFDSEIEQLCRTHSITLTAGDDGVLSWSGAEHSKMRNGDIVEWENMGVLLRGTVISRTSSGSYDTLAVVYDFDGDEPLELHVLWINSNGTATDACFSSDQTLASAFNAKQTKLEDTTDVVIESETDTTDGLYLTDKAKMRLFIDQWNAAWNINGTVYGKYDPEHAPDALHPFMGNEIWMTYEEAILVMEYSSGFSAYQRIALVDIPIKTLLPIPLNLYDTYVDIMGMRELRAIRFIENRGNAKVISQQPWFISSCGNLTRIEGTFNISNMDSSACWRFLRSSANIKEFRASGLNKNLNLQTNSKLSLATMQYLVDNASTAITAEKPVVAPSMPTSSRSSRATQPTRPLLL